jgi:hypothetical protein
MGSESTAQTRLLPRVEGRKDLSMPVASRRIDRVLKLVDELELDPEEKRTLAAELLEPPCVVDWEEVSPDDQELVKLVERRLNHSSGPMIRMTEAMRMARERIAELRAARSSTRALRFPRRPQKA